MAFLLFFFRLTAAGMLGKDEPRYAFIGRAMAQTGDWITPRLWGSPWFEKPPLLYWLTAAGFKLGLGDDLAPRFLVALLSVAFLAFYWWALRREFGCRAAWMATLILSTASGWVAFSYAGVTDLPLSATFGAAMLLALPWIARGETRALPWAAAMLGVAVLAKSLVPVVLAAPVVLQWRSFGDLLRPRVWAAFLAVALPWHILCYANNGWPFIEELFVKHQFGRFVSGELMHQQPWWFYLPNLLWELLPWTLLLPLVWVAMRKSDPRRNFFALWAVWGMVFFSASVNKLPGYILPLLPAVAALIALGLEEVEAAAPWLIAGAALLTLYPVCAAIASTALASSVLHAGWPGLSPWQLAPALAALPAWYLEKRRKRLAAVFCVAAGAAIGVAYLKIEALPEIDRFNSARTLWREIEPVEQRTCVGWMPPAMRYSLNYYTHSVLPDCSAEKREYEAYQATGQLPGLKKQQ
jgi:4-amino-4-deoxy-L-arabinose transferase-like glycosyltransferase